MNFCNLVTVEVWAPASTFDGAAGGVRHEAQPDSASTAQKATGAGPAPDIDLPTLTGGHVKLSSLKGHPVVVTFWGAPRRLAASISMPLPAG